MRAEPVDTTMPCTLVRPDAHIAWRGEPAALPSALAAAGLAHRASDPHPRR